MQHLWLQHRQYKVRIWRNAVICTSSICPSPQRDKDLQLSSITADQWVIRARLTLINRPIYNSFVWVSSSSLPPLPALFSDSCLAGIHSLEGRVATILLTGCLRFPELIKQRCCSPCLTVFSLHGPEATFAHLDLFARFLSPDVVFNKNKIWFWKPASNHHFWNWRPRACPLNIIMHRQKSHVFFSLWVSAQG